MTQERASVVVVGAGFGGIGAALTLAEQGADVVLCESLTYPGGCASTFERFGLSWETGATLFSGFGEGQLFRRWVERYALDVRWQVHDPAMQVHLGDLSLAVPPDRSAWAERLAALPGAPAAGIRAFFAEQGRVADALWQLLDQPTLLPPLDGRSVLTHARNAPMYAPMVRWIGRPLSAVAEAHGVADFAPLMRWLDAACQITVQTPARSAEALFAMGAMDVLFRDACTVEGGIGVFASAALEAIEQAGGRVRMGNSVRSVVREGDGWRVKARHGDILCDAVVANVLPQTASRWLDEPVAPDLSAQLDAGWGAVMRYAALEDHPSLPEGTSHHQIVFDPGAPLIEGNHALVTVGAPQPLGGRMVRCVTASTHLRMDHPTDAVPDIVGGVQERLRHALRDLFPGVPVALDMTASPRTFARFTGRHRGLVGGVPRHAGLHHYATMVNPPHRAGFWLVGDSVFPGQSTLACAIGGQRVAVRVMQSGRVRDRRERAA